MGTHVAAFSAIDPAYSLPENIAIITLQARLARSLLNFLWTRVYKLMHECGCNTSKSK